MAISMSDKPRFIKDEKRRGNLSDEQVEKRWQDFIAVRHGLREVDGRLVRIEAQQPAAPAAASPVRLTASERNELPAEVEMKMGPDRRERQAVAYIQSGVRMGVDW